MTAAPAPEGVLKDTKARNTIKGLGDETAEFPLAKPYTSGPLAGQTTETVHTYGWYNRKYIADIRAKGATPILLTPTDPQHLEGRQIERDMGFRDFDQQIAAQQHVPLADMAAIEADYLQIAWPGENRCAVSHRPHPHQPRRRGAEREVGRHGGEAARLAHCCLYEAVTRSPAQTYVFT